MIYLARPVDYADEHGTNLSRRVRRRLTDLKQCVFDPGTAWHGAPEHVQAVWRINEAALAEADALLAILPMGVTTVGVPMEIQGAVDQGKPVTVLADRWSLQLSAMAAEGKLRLYGLEDEADAVAWCVQSLRDRAARLRRELRATQMRFVSDSLDGEYTPRISYEGDAGWDLIVSQSTVIWPQEFKDVPCGISVELPEGVWAMITGRSSTLRKRRLLVAQGIIDNGYRGPLYSGVWNLGDEKQQLEPGERIAQLIPFPVLTRGVRWERVSELTGSERGTAGFGSTGT